MNLLSTNYTKYALIMCAVLIICLASIELTGNNQNFDKSPLVAIWTFIAPFIIWFLGIRAKKKAQKGKLTFKQGFFEGLKISVVFGIISPFIFLGYYVIINPEILEYVKGAYGLSNQPNEIVILVDLGAQFISSIIGGGLYSALIAFILKSK